MTEAAAAEDLVRIDAKLAGDGNGHQGRAILVAPHVHGAVLHDERGAYGIGAVPDLLMYVLLKWEIRVLLSSSNHDGPGAVTSKRSLPFSPSSSRGQKSVPCSSLLACADAVAARGLRSGYLLSQMQRRYKKRISQSPEPFSKTESAGSTTSIRAGRETTTTPRIPCSPCNPRMSSPCSSVRR